MQVYSRNADSVEAFLALRGFLNEHLLDEEHNAGMLAEHLYFEHYLDYVACSCCVEAALAVLKNEDGVVLW